MKKFLFFLLCCAVPVTADAADIFNFNDSFNLAKAVKLGRGSAYSVAADSNVNTGTGKTEITKSCSTGCSDCDTSTGWCDACQSRYAKDNAGKCHSCPDNCASCLWEYGNTISCETCDSGYELATNSSTGAGPFYCKKAETVCSTDEVWGDVNNGKCAVFGLNSEGICACLQCKAGYVDASYPAGQGPDIGTTYCIACPENGTCDGTRNVTCDAGYTHISAGQTSYAMGHRCEKTTCPAGYFTSLRTGECVQSQCYPNRYLGENECLNFEGCKECFYNSSCPGWQCQDDLGTLGSATTSCSAGEYLSNGTCVACSEGTYSKGGTVTSCTSCTTLYTSAGSNTCTSCTTDGTCTGSNGGSSSSSSSSGSSSSCPTGDMIGYTCVNGVKTKCLYEGCQSCANDTLKCLSCKSGYTYTAGSNCL